EKQAPNMIIVSGTHCGMEAHTWDDNELPDQNSAILTFGPDLLAFNGKTYDNIGFDIHVYDQWANDSVGFYNKFDKLLGKFKGRGYAVLVGEVGTPPNDGFHQQGYQRHYQGTKLAYDIALQKYGYGIVHWHYDPEDDFTLIDGPHKQNYGININSCTNPTNLSWWGGQYFWTATHQDGYGLNDLSGGNNGNQTPYAGVINLPGMLQVENFDNGGQGTAYSDNDAGNNGGAYRNTERVDIEGTSDTGGGYNVGWTNAGEWLEYTVDVPSTGSYDIDIRHAGTSSGTLEITFSNGGTTGDLTLPSTGGWQTWTTTTASNISLGAGEQVLRINLKSGGMNLNYLEVKNGGGNGNGNCPITVRAQMLFGSGDNLNLLIDDVNVHTFNISGSSLADYTFNANACGSNIKLDFPDNGTDMRIDYLIVDGTTYQAEDQTVNTSVWQGGSCGGSNSDLLHCPGYLEFPLGGGNNNGGTCTYTVRARMSYGTADEINLRVDGTDVHTWNLTASYSEQTWSGPCGNVEINYADANGDVQIDWLEIDGDRRQAEMQATNTAAWLNGSCGGGGFSEFMHCPGLIDFGNASGSGARLGGLGQSTLASVYPVPSDHLVNLVAAEDAMLTIVSIEGKTIFHQQILADQILSLELAPGLYLARFRAASGMQTSKIIIR
ncbi:MAG: carbohydrate-binding protein, partial [Bacteroidota bacterium]